MNFDLLCVGLAVSDILATPVPEDLFQKDTVILKKISYQPGGDAFNVASGAAALGIKTALAARLGGDPAGGILRTQAEKRGIDGSCLVTDPEAATATSLVLITGDGERHFVYSPGANNSFSAADIPETLWGQFRHLHVGSAMLLPSLDGDGLAALFKKARAQGVTTSMDVAFDPDGLWLQKIEKALPFTDYFLPSLGEAQAITGKREPQEIAEFLIAQGVGTVVVKLGEQGAYLHTKSTRCRIPALTAGKVVDTTGAGDCFVAVFISAVLRGYSAQEAAQLASAGAGICVGNLGANCGLTGFPQLEAVLEATHIPA